MEVSVMVNGKSYQHDVPPRLLLVHYIREYLNLTGAHVGCDTSQCGACVVFVDGQSVKSCTMLAVQADGREVLTVEGLAQDGNYHPIQEGFWEMHGLQCGFCTPGMIMSAYGLLKENPNPNEAEIRRALDGNLCRCTGYQNIVKAVQYAARQRGGGAMEAGPGTDLEFQHEDVVEHAPENLQDWGDQLAGQEEQ